MTDNEKYRGHKAFLSLLEEKDARIQEILDKKWLLEETLEEERDERGTNSLIKCMTKD